MDASLRLLVAPDTTVDIDRLLQATCDGGYLPALTCIASCTDLHASLTMSSWDLLLVKQPLPWCDVVAVRAMVELHMPDLPIVVVLDSPELEHGRKVLRDGANDYFASGDWTRLIPILDRELLAAEERRTRRLAEGAQFSAAPEAVPDAMATIDVAEIFRLAFDSAVVGMALTAPDGHFIRLNPAFCLLLGYTADELSSGTFMRITYPDDIALSRRQMQQLVSGNVDAVQFEKRYIHQDGHVVWVQLTASLVRDGQGQPLYTTTQLMDISARKAAEEALKASEARLRSFVEVLPVGAILTAPSGEVLMSNRATSEILGFSPEQLLGTAIQAHQWDARTDDGTPMELEWLPTPAAGSDKGASRTLVIDVARGDGAGRALVQRSVLPIVSGDGSLTGVIATFTDISALRQAEAELRHSEARLRSQYQDLPAPMYTFQRHGDDFVLVDFNRAATQITRGGIHAHLGSTANALFSHAPEATEYMARCWDERRTFEHETRFRYRTTGEIRDLSASYVFVPPDLVLLHTIDITERKQAESATARLVARLGALRAIDASITGSLDLHLTLGVLLEQVTTHLGVDAADVLLLDAADSSLAFAASRGIRHAARIGNTFRLGDVEAGRAVLERRQIYVPELDQEHATDEGFVSYYAVPLVAKGEVKGVLELFHRASLPPEPEWMKFLEALAGQAAIAIDNGTLFKRMQRSNLELGQAYDTTIEGWSRALDLRDKETEGHSERVTAMTLVLARAMGIGEAEMVHLRRGALLHDIGKMGIPDSILFKPGPLTDDEWTVMRRHPTHAYDLLAPIAYLRPALDIPYCHHEKWDGTGYPRGLCGQDIPFAARIFAVADVWDALRSDRPYRPGWTEDNVQKHIRSQARHHFDPRVVAAFFDLNTGELPFNRAT